MPEKSCFVAFNIYRISWFVWFLIANVYLILHRYFYLNSTCCVGWEVLLPLPPSRYVPVFQYVRLHIIVYSERTYFQIIPISVRSLSSRHYFPQQDSKTPDITCSCKQAIFDRFWCCPSHWNFTSLQNKCFDHCIVQRTFSSCQLINIKYC